MENWKTCEKTFGNIKDLEIEDARDGTGGDWKRTESWKMWKEWM
jgi:hypothetical protein